MSEVSSVTQNPDSNSLSKNSTLKIILIAIKLVITASLLGLAGLMVFLHNAVNLGGRAFFDEQTTVAANTAELAEFITSQIEASARMNFVEIGIWILLPTFAVISAIVLWQRKRLIILIGAVAFFILFSIAQITNLVGANKDIEENIPKWDLLFKIIEYPGAGTYEIKNSSDFENGEHRRIMFETTDDVLKLKEFYRIKGFEDARGSSNATYMVNSGFYDKLEDYRAITFKEIGGKIEVAVYE